MTNARLKPFRPARRRIVWCGLLIAAGAPGLAPRDAVAAMCISGSLDSTDASQIGRLARNSPQGASVCGALKAVYGLADPVNPRLYDLFHFTNTGTATTCATFTLVWTGANVMFVTGYTPGGFDPANIQTGYLGDGNGVASPLAMGFTLVPSAGVDVVVSAIAPGVPAGPYTLIASGDLFGTAGCFPPTVTLTATPSAAVWGQAVALTVAVTSPAGIPTGTVTFQDGTTVLGSGTLDATGQASYTTSSLAVGTHPLSVVYSGDAIHAALTSTPTSLTVSTAQTTTTVSSSQNPQAGDAPVTFSATVAVTAPGAGTPTGTVTFFDGTTPLSNGPLTAGQATFTAPTLPVGDHAITASYSGDNQFHASTSAVLTETIQRFVTSISVVADPTAALFGDVVQLTATASSTSGTPTGMVAFTDGTVPLGSAALDSAGKAAILTTTLSVGTHTITAAYGGDATRGAASSSIVYLVNRATSATTLTTSPSPSAFGETVSLTATVASDAGVPGGTVTFLEAGAPLGTVALDGSGIATLYVSSLGVGGHNLIASYGGDPTFSASSSTAAAQTVSKAATSALVGSSSNPAAVGPVTFTAIVTATAPGAGAPSGMVSFNDGDTLLGTASLDSHGSAALIISSLVPGTHTISAAYAGDDSFSGSTSATLAQVIAEQTPTATLTAGPNPSTYGQEVTFTATLVASSPDGSTPTGNVTFKERTTILGIGTLNGGGSATLAVHTLAAGTHMVTLSYGGDAAHVAGATASVTLVVHARSTTTMLVVGPRAATVGQEITLAATVTPDSDVASASGDLNLLDGMVTFKDGTTIIGMAPLSAGTATLTTTTLTAGTHLLSASYGGATNYAASASPQLSQRVSPTPTMGGGGGCGCRAANDVSPSAAALGVGLALLLWTRRRRLSSRS